MTAMNLTTCTHCKGISHDMNTCSVCGTRFVPVSGLLPCPFCDFEEPHMGIDGNVTCGNCGAKGPWDKDAYDDAGNEQEMWNERRAVTIADVQQHLMDEYERMREEIKTIPRTGTGTLTTRHKLRGTMDANIALSNWIDRQRPKSLPNDKVLLREPKKGKTNEK